MVPKISLDDVMLKYNVGVAGSQNQTISADEIARDTEGFVQDFISLSPADQKALLAKTDLAAINDLSNLLQRKLKRVLNPTQKAKVWEAIHLVEKTTNNRCAVPQQAWVNQQFSEYIRPVLRRSAARSQNPIIKTKLLDTPYERIDAEGYLDLFKLVFMRRHPELAPFAHTFLMRAVRTIRENPSASFEIIDDPQAPYAPLRIAEQQLPFSFPNTFRWYANKTNLLSREDRTATITLTDKEWLEITAPLATEIKDAATEREAIKQVVANLERKALEKLCPEGQHCEDKGGWTANIQARAEGDQLWQTDCQADSSNTQQLLSILTRVDSPARLKFHRALSADISIRAESAYEAYHLSAVIIEKETGTRFVVDSWLTDAGSPPVIQREDEWMQQCSEEAIPG